MKKKKEITDVAPSLRKKSVFQVFQKKIKILFLLSLCRRRRRRTPEFHKHAPARLRLQGPHTKNRNRLVVRLPVGFEEVAEQAAPLTENSHQAASSTIVLFVLLQVRGELGDARRKSSDLCLSGADVVGATGDEGHFREIGADAAVAGAVGGAGGVGGKKRGGERKLAAGKKNARMYKKKTLLT